MTALLTRPRIVDKPIAETTPPAPSRPAEKPPRLVSLDAYRGFIMIMMASSGLYLSRVAEHVPADDPLQFLRLWVDSVPDRIYSFLERLGWGKAEFMAAIDSLYSFLEQLGCGKTELMSAWRFLAFHSDHVAWVGGGLWDMIQPAFMFMVGVAIPYSYASRKAKGQSEGVIWFHTIWRALFLVVLAVFLSSPLRHSFPISPAAGALGSSATAAASLPSETYFIFTNVLAQIGLGYAFVFLLRGRGLWVQLAALGAVLVGSWLLFFLYQPGPEFDYAAAGAVQTDWGQTPTWFGSQMPDWLGSWYPTHMPAWFAHWDKNANAGAAFETWFLNLSLLRRQSLFVYNEGGYTTLNFLPSMATMILGLMAGELLRAPGRRWVKFLWLVAAGFGCLVLGLLAGDLLCPIVKRIWTPSWAVYSSGWVFLMLAGFYGVVDLIGWKRWALPLTVVGMNSIAIYCMSQLMRRFLRDRFSMHLPAWWFGEPYGIILQSALILLIFWLVCALMYRSRIFLRI
jgi:heparan-alpha-glucosaminide N-acetyltransferase